jgi:photosynthetic reaction center H subunit
MSSGTGAITGYIDVAQVVLYAFWIFFAGLIYYLQRESKREGFPLESDLPSGETRFSRGMVGVPSPKTFLLAHGEAVTVPNAKRTSQALAARPSHAWIGAPLEPTGNPMLDGVGPGSYNDRADVPDRMINGEPTIVPLRVAHGYGVADKDPDPRGMQVFGADGSVGGTVTDLWIDKAEMIFRYLELTVPAGNAWRQVLLPMNFARVSDSGVKVQSILADQFAQVPGLRNAEQVTLLEEEKIVAYYGGGTLYASPDRQEPLV